MSPSEAYLEREPVMGMNFQRFALGAAKERPSQERGRGALLTRWTDKSRISRIVAGAISATVLFASVTTLAGVGAAGAATVTGVTFTPGSAGADAASTWTVGFAASSSGALASGNSVSLTFGSGFAIPAAPAVTFASGFTGGCAGTTTGTTAGQVVTIPLSGTCALNASTAATLTVAGIKNPAAGSYANTGFTVATSKDTATSPVANVVIVASPTGVATSAATSLTAHTATLNGTLNPNGVATTYYFEYGTTLAYGATTPVLSAGSGVAAVAVSANIAGLSSNINYFAQLVATNANGTSYGGSMTVTTMMRAHVRLILRKSSDPFGKETRQRLTVSVTSSSGGTAPTGQVALMAGNATLCTVTLSAGAGRCSLTARELSVRTFRIYAVYLGAGLFASSTSDNHLYRVVKG